MTSKIVVNNIQTDAGISSVTLLSHVAGHDSTQNISGINSVTANAFYGSGANLTGIDATKIETGNTKVETIDTGSDGHIKFTTEGGERLRITSDGRLLMGVTTSQQGDANLQVFRADTTSRITFGNENVSASGIAGIDFCPSNKVQGSRIECQAQEDFSTAANRTADLVFFTRKDGTSSEKLRINSSGHVTKPANPSFRATAGSALDYTSDNTIQFSNERHDIGGNYNNSNSYYTIPTTGYYKFEVMHFAQPGQVARVQLESSTDGGSNWSTIQIGPRIESSGSGRYIAGWMHVFHEFTATNIVRVRWSQGNVHVNNGYGWFQGWLVN